MELTHRCCEAESMCTLREEHEVKTKVISPGVGAHAASGSPCARLAASQDVDECRRGPSAPPHRHPEALNRSVSSLSARPSTLRVPELPQGTVITPRLGRGPPGMAARPCRHAAGDRSTNRVSISVRSIRWTPQASSIRSTRRNARDPQQ